MRRPGLRPTRPALLVAGGALAVALVARLPLIAGRTDVPPGFDVPDYLLVAEGIWNGNPFEEPVVPRTVGYPALMVAPIRLPFDDVQSIITTQHLLGPLLVAAIVLAAWRLFGSVTAIAAGVLAAASPLLIMIEDEVAPDMAFAAFLLAVAVAVAAVARTPRPPRWALPALGALIGAAALVKPVAQLLVLAVPLALGAGGLPVRDVARGSLVAALFAALVVSPWVIHNLAEHGRPVLSQQDGLTLFNRVFEVDERPITGESADDRFVREMARRSAKQVFPPENRLHSAVFLELMRRGRTNIEAIAFERRYARREIGRYPVEYSARTVATLPGVVRDVGKVINEDDQPGDRSDSAAEAVAAPLWWAGRGLSQVWVFATLFGAVALITPFAGPRERRAAAASFLAVWGLVAVGTAAAHGGLVRYSAELAPLTWIIGSYGLVLVAGPAVAMIRARARKSSSS